MKMAMFCNSLTQEQITLFADLLNQTRDNELFTTTRLPTSVKDINKHHIKGSNSILKNLPIPSVHIRKNHAYVSLTSIIQLFLAFGYDSDYLTTSDNEDESYGIRNCKQAHMIRDRVTNMSEHHNIVPMILYITFWSDDFEATQIKKIQKFHLDQDYNHMST